MPRLTLTSREARLIVPRNDSGRHRLTEAEATDELYFTLDTRGLRVPDALALVDRAMSASTVNSVLSCPARWAAEKTVAEPYDPFSPLVLGNASHALFEKLYSLPPAERGSVDLSAWFEDEFADLAVRGVAGGTVPEGERLAWVDAAMGKVAGWLAGAIEKPEDIRVVAVEMEVRTDIDGISFVGFLDRVSEDEGGLVIEDYKTSNSTKSFPDNACQQQLYLAACREVGGIGGRVPDRARLLYTKLGEVHDVDASDLSVARAVERLVQTRAILDRAGDSGIFPASRNPFCAYCSIAPSCPSRNLARKLLDDRHYLTLPATTSGALSSLSHVSGADEWGASGSRTVSVYSTNMNTTNMTAPAEATQSATEQRLLPPLSSLADVTGLKEGRYATEDVNADGNLNPSTYSMDALWDLWSWSAWFLKELDMGYDSDSQEMLFRVVARLTARLQEKMTNEVAWKTRSNKIARSCVKEAVRRNVPPFGADESRWKAWEVRVLTDAFAAWWAMSSIMVDNIVDHVVNPLPTFAAPAVFWRVAA